MGRADRARRERQSRRLTFGRRPAAPASSFFLSGFICRLARARRMAASARRTSATKRVRPLLPLAALLALSLSACGGGGGLSAPGANDSRSSTSATSSRAVLYTNAEAAARTAAAADPVHARQSTFIRGNLFTGTRQTLDYSATHQATRGLGSEFSPAATLFTERDSGGPIDYVLIYTNDVTSYQPLFLNTTSGDDSWKKASAVHGTATYTADNGATVLLSTAELSATSTDGQRVGHATVFTDYDVNANDTDDSVEAVPDNPGTPGIDETTPAIPDGTGDDTDYMAAGVWVSGPFSEANSGYSAFAGAFAMGKVPYTGLATGHDALTSVSYKGLAGGKRFSGGTATDFTTTVSLTANFSATATISGTVADVGGGQKLKLLAPATAFNRATDGGPYSGLTQLVGADGSDVSGFTGKWGGAFYGATDDAKGPRGTAGTFSASGTGDTILGAFIAHRQ